MHNSTYWVTRLALQDLNNAFTYYLDQNQIDPLVALFTEDAIYTHDVRRSEGRAAIRVLLETRAAAGPRTTRHVSTGLRVEIQDGSLATGYSVCVTYAANAVPPIVNATPCLVADFEDQYRLETDGQWRIRRRHIRRIFVPQ